MIISQLVQAKISIAKERANLSTANEPAAIIDDVQSLLFSVWFLCEGLGTTRRACNSSNPESRLLDHEL